MATVPDHIKKNVRAVLLSKVGGILVSDFTKDYKTLLQQQLNFKQHGFHNLTDMIKAMPDVVRLDFSDKDLAYKMFGIVDPNSTYTPLSAKLAAGSSPDSKKDNKRVHKSHTSFGMSNGNSDGDGKYADFLPNMRGHYTLCYPRFKEGDDATKESLEEKFGEFPGLFEVHLIPKMIFVRYTIKDSAIQCIEKYESSLTIRVAEEKQPSRKPGGGGGDRKEKSYNDDSIMSKRSDNRRRSDEDNTANKKSSGKDTDLCEVFVGNLTPATTEDELQEMVSQLDPVDLRIKSKKDNPDKCFAFIGFKDVNSAQMCVKKLNRLEVKGQNLHCRLANKEGNSLSSRIEEPSAPSGGKMPWKSFGGATSSKPSEPEEDDESWDTPNPNKTSQPTAGSSTSWKSLLKGGNAESSPQTSSFGQSSSSFGQSSSSFGQSSSSFGQSKTSSDTSQMNGHNESSFGKSSTAFGQSSSTGQSENSSGQSASSSSFGQNASSFGKSSLSSSQNVSSSDQTASSSFGQKSLGSAKTENDNSDPEPKSSGWRGSSNDKHDKRSDTRSKSNDLEVYFGNLHSSITKEVFTDMMDEFCPLQIRYKQDGPKIFAFVELGSAEMMDLCVQKYDGMEVQGRAIKCHAKTNNSSQDRNRQNSGPISPNNNQQGKSELSSKFGSLTIQTDTSTFSRSAASPRQQITSPKQQVTSPRQQVTSPKYSSPQKPAVNKARHQKSPQKPREVDYSDMPQLEGEPKEYADMPPLETDPGDCPYVNGHGGENFFKVFVGNFPYYESELDLLEWFQPLGAVDITITNTANTFKTTGALLDFLDEETAQAAINETHQNLYKGRLILVQPYEPNPEKRKDTGGINLSISAGADGRRSVSLNAAGGHVKAQCEARASIRNAVSNDSIASSESKTSVKSFKGLMTTYKIIMNSLGTRVRDMVFKPYEDIMIYVTSVFDETCFWGQVVRDDSTLKDLEDVLEVLQDQDSRIGYTTGLGRCAALIDNEWTRSWVISSHRQDFTIEVFNVDFGNTAVLKKNHAFKTIPEIWDLHPVVRPFKVIDGNMKVDKNMEQSLINVKVVDNSTDETKLKEYKALIAQFEGFLTGVKILNVVDE